MQQDMLWKKIKSKVILRERECFRAWLRWRRCAAKTCSCTDLSPWQQHCHEHFSCSQTKGGSPSRLVHNGCSLEAAQHTAGIPAALAKGLLGTEQQEQPLQPHPARHPPSPRVPEDLTKTWTSKSGSMCLSALLQRGFQGTMAGLLLQGKSSLALH